jgi:hypothetical protein
MPEEVKSPLRCDFAVPHDIAEKRSKFVRRAKIEHFRRAYITMCNDAMDRVPEPLRHEIKLERLAAKDGLLPPASQFGIWLCEAHYALWKKYKSLTDAYIVGGRLLKILPGGRLSGRTLSGLNAFQVIGKILIGTRRGSKDAQELFEGNVALPGPDRHNRSDGVTTAFDNKFLPAISDTIQDVREPPCQLRSRYLHKNMKIRLFRICQ